MTNYYNEFNPQSAAMLKQMMLDRIIPHGDVDTRPIQEVQAHEIKGYKQCHFFAGIGGWSIALKLAGWPSDRPVWTGSCPCQPFSSAGKQKGKKDERHLWPVWFRLIQELRPSIVFGEQVERAIAHGWLDDVYQGLESEGYAVGSAVLPACSVGAPHKRDRLWFVGHAEHDGSHGRQVEGGNGPAVCDNAQGQDSAIQFEGASQSGNVADSGKQRSQGHGGFGKKHDTQGRQAEERHPWQSGVWIDCPDGKQRLVESSIPLLADGVQHRKPILHAFGNAIVPQVAAEFIEAFTKTLLTIALLLTAPAYAASVTFKPQAEIVPPLSQEGLHFQSARGLNLTVWKPQCEELIRRGLNPPPECEEILEGLEE
jgi:DNA (cytosine-5)-methyltransferase 1